MLKPLLLGLVLAATAFGVVSAQETTGQPAGDPAVSDEMASDAQAEPGPAPYMDDRSDAETVVRSFYNAINRKEFARAWSYFGDQKPAKDYETFVAGYQDTLGVIVATGRAGMEGAAGSLYYSLPVAIQATGTDNSERVFAGCYTLRLVQPTNQEPPYRGLTIDKASLKPAEAPYDAQVPQSCGDAPPQEEDAALVAARKLYLASFAGRCDNIRPDGVVVTPPESNEITYKPSYASADDPPQTVRLFRFFCGSGAYNESHVYMLWSQEDGVRLLQFATPDLDIRYKDPDSDAKVESLSIRGYLAETELINSSYDPATQSITSFSKWRGIADASSSGKWLFRDGSFTLVKYEVDASYDEQINPETILDFDTAP